MELSVTESQTTGTKSARRYRCPRCGTGEPIPQPAESYHCYLCGECGHGWDSILSCLVIREDRDEAHVESLLEKEQRAREDNPSKTHETGF